MVLAVQKVQHSCSWFIPEIILEDRERLIASFARQIFFDATINEADLLNLGSWKEDLGAWALVPCKAKNKSYFVIYILQFMG